MPKIELKVTARGNFRYFRGKAGRKLGESLSVSEMFMDIPVYLGISFFTNSSNFLYSIVVIQMNQGEDIIYVAPSKSQVSSVAEAAAFYICFFI